jgi:hypothetical protein
VVKAGAADHEYFLPILVDMAYQVDAKLLDKEELEFGKKTRSSVTSGRQSLRRPSDARVL